MRRLGEVVAVLVILTVSAGFIYAAGTDAQKCQVSKIKAASKKLSGKLKCIAKAASKGVPVDATCLAIADTKFLGGFSKAENKGGCALTGDEPTLETSVDNDVNAVLALTTLTPLGCCSDPNFLSDEVIVVSPACYYASDPNDCTAAGGIPGGAGTVCDSATGTCKTPPAVAGGTCSGNFPSFGCVAGPWFKDVGDFSFGPPYRADVFGCWIMNIIEDPNTLAKFDPNAVCPPDGGRAVE